MFSLTSRTRIEGVTDSRASQLAVSRMYRDMERVLDSRVPEEARLNRICFEKCGHLEEESWIIKVTEEEICVSAGDDLGIVYAFFEVSGRFLGIHPFWFWMDQKVEKRALIRIEDQILRSPFRKVKYRGWFFNDETFIARWHPYGRESLPWEMGFEALLRCGGNMVIPGDDENFRKYSQLAADMGLILTHHHVEVLGAEMFLAVYPELNPSYTEHADLFEELWEEAVRRQAGNRTIWAIGFRGQSDCAFWESEESGMRMSSQERGEFIAAIMKRQMELVKSYVPDAVFCTNLYGELMELYREGCLEVPEGVIKIWANNGYGKMVARRRGNHNPRIPALPQSEKEREGKHGIYYHASFYDLQAASHTTMLLQTPEYFDRNLWEAFEAGLTEYLIINCSNVRPHVCTLEMMSRIWNGEHITSEDFYSEFAGEYFGENRRQIAALYKKYAECAILYGSYDDEVAGEQFYTHSVRILAGQWIRDFRSAAEGYQWAKRADTLDEQIKWLSALCRGKVEEYTEYAAQCQSVGDELYGPLTVQVTVHKAGLSGIDHFCRAWELWKRGDEMEAFYECGLSAESFSEGHEAFERAETDIWKGFYAYEHFADFKFAAHVLRNLMGYIRISGDGDQYYQWDAVLLRKKGKGVVFPHGNNHQTEVELFQRMKELRGEIRKDHLIVWRRV